MIKIEEKPIKKKQKITIKNIANSNKMMKSLTRIKSYNFFFYFLFLFLKNQNLFIYFFGN